MEHPLTPEVGGYGPGDEEEGEGGGTFIERVESAVEESMATYFNTGPDLTEDQISEIIRHGNEEQGRKHTRAKLVLAFLAFFLVIIVGLCWLFLHYDRGELLQTLVATLVGFLAGGAGGYGLGVRNASSE